MTFDMYMNWVMIVGINQEIEPMLIENSSHTQKISAKILIILKYASALASPSHPRQGVPHLSAVLIVPLYRKKKEKRTFYSPFPIALIINHFKSMEAHPTFIGIVMLFHIVVDGFVNLGKVRF